MRAVAGSDGEAYYLSFQNNLRKTYHRPHDVDALQATDAVRTRGTNRRSGCSIPIGMRLTIFFPQHHEIDAGPLDLAGHGRPDEPRLLCPIQIVSDRAARHPECPPDLVRAHAI